MTLTSTPAGNEAQTFRLTQSILVLGVVVGGVFLVLIAANIAMGILLWVHERRSEGQSHGHDGIVSTSEHPSAKKRRDRRPLPGTLRMVYRRQTRTESGSFDDDKVTFEVSESVDSSESEDVDGGWHVIQERSSGIQARPGTQLYQQKWQEVLNPKNDIAIEFETNQRNMNRCNSHQSSLSRTPFQSYEDGIINNVKNSEIGSSSEKTYDYAAEAGELEGDGRFNEKMGNNLNRPTERDGCIGGNILSSTEVDISDKNTPSKLITEFPVLQNGLIIDIPIKRRSRKTKPSQPGKLYRKKHEIVRLGKTERRHYGSPMSKRLIPSPSHPLAVPQPFTQEIISENKKGKNNGQQNNFNSGMGKSTVMTADFTPGKKREETNTSPDERTICIEERERKDQGGSNKGDIPWKVQRCSDMIKQCSEVSRTLYDATERTNTVELSSDRLASMAEGIDNTESFVPPIRPDHYITAPRSPILDWSISDDAKQSYFSQAQALPIDKAQYTLFSITSTSDEMFIANQSGNINYQPLDLRHASIQSTSAEEQVTHHTISADSSHKKSIGRKNRGIDNYSNISDNYSNMRLVKMPARKRSFMHRLFDRSKQTKNPNILKTFYSEDLTHSNTGSKRFPQGQQYKNAVYELEETGFQPQISPYVSTVHVPNKYPLTNVTPRFTLSEEDLRMYPDDSIPTIDELVQNGTIKRKKAAKKQIKRNRGNTTTPSRLTENDNFVLNVPKHQLRTEMQRYTNTTNNAVDMAQYSNHRGGELSSNESNRHPWGVDVDLIGFHTGVSNRYHSISDKKALDFGNIGFQHRIGLRGPIFIPNPRMESNQDTILTADNGQVNTVWPLPKTDDLGDGNWNISITTTAESQSSKEVDSVSSFALSDFDMGESDVDEVSNISGDEDGTLNDGNCVAGNGDSREENVRAIEDVRL